MTTLWAIEVTPLDGRGKPWIDHTTVSGLRRYAWAIFAVGTPLTIQEIKRRRRKGLLRAVKVTIQISSQN